MTKVIRMVQNWSGLIKTIVFFLIGQFIFLLLVMQAMGATYFQVGAYQDEGNAQRVQSILLAQGLPVTTNRDRPGFHRVQVGPVSDTLLTPVRTALLRDGWELIEINRSTDSSNSLAHIPSPSTKTDQATLASPQTGKYKLADVQGSVDARLQIARHALTYLGTDYQWGGNNKTGIDCSGLTKRAYAAVGIALPHRVALQYRMVRHILLPYAKLGDIVFFSTTRPGPSHCGVYLGGGDFIHASSNSGVRIDNLMKSDYYRVRLLGFGQLVGIDKARTRG